MSKNLKNEKIPNFQKLGCAWAQSSHTVTLCTHAYG